MRIKSFIVVKVIVISVLFSCANSENFKLDLLSNDKEKIIKASYELGEIRDTTSVKNLLNKALDPRITHNLKFYGSSVNYSKLIALQKISNNAYTEKINQHQVDTIATIFFRDWAIKNKYLKNEAEVDINYY
ncbi:hypothetical protein [Jejuia spongiicola]|uniref:Uncharacterized protein n=1 Tax=Jejuia spongiicola TaxID=2942207 RepID=A0ABT0QAV4_9FLAO|nr:hypothetical protein [Jejuia spongiicola]MCL6294024.1 hypothetical protein [Jejuia spongiicola]